jgi:transposase
VLQKQLSAMGDSDFVFLRSVRDRRRIEQWARSRTLASRVVVRSRIVLMLADGHGVKAVAHALGVSVATVRLWRKRAQVLGIDALLRDAAGRGRKPSLDKPTRDALRRQHAQGHDPMTVRARARELGVSAATVSRWRRRQ